MRLGRRRSGWSASSRAALLRRKLIVDEALPFPTGNATGEAHRDHVRARAPPALRRARLLIGGGAGRGGRHLVPRRAPRASSRSMTPFGGAVGGIVAGRAHRRDELEPAAALDRRHDGHARGASMFAGRGDRLGGARALAGAAPRRRHAGSFSGCLSWLVWPGAGPADGGQLPAAAPGLALGRARRARPGRPGPRRAGGATGARPWRTRGAAARAGRRPGWLVVVAIAVVGRAGLRPAPARRCWSLLSRAGHGRRLRRAPPARPTWRRWARSGR